MNLRLAISACLFSVSVFSQPSADKKLFTELKPVETGVTFANNIYETADMFYYKYEYLYVGAGVGVGDINNDGLQDLYFASTLGSNKLYLNEGNFKFRDITSSAGVSGGPGMKTGVNMIDINSDGYLDILVSKSGPGDPANRKKVLYINNKNGTFTDQAEKYGLDDASYTTQSYFLDYDNDGDKDVFFVNHPVDFTYATLIPVKSVNGKMVYAEDTTTTYVSCRLLENRNNKFVDITKKAGLITHAFGLSATIHDFNNDGFQDIYVANDFNKPDYLFINNKNGTFTDKLTEYIDHISLSSMGSDMNDINNDGLEDLFVVDMAIEDPVRQKQLFVQNLNYDKFQLLLRFGLYYQYPRNTLQLNNGNGKFSEIAYYSGVAQTDWSWAPLIVDYDNDKWKDIFVTNGLKRDISDWDYKVFVLDSIKNLMARGVAVKLEDWFKLIPEVRIKNYFYRNNGSLKFDNYSDKWVDQTPTFSNGGVYADLDNDGDVDLITNNIDDPATIYRNNTREQNGGNFLRFRVLKSKSDPTEVYGTTIHLYCNNQVILSNRFEPQRGYMGSNEHFVHFGIAGDVSIPKVLIDFPDGRWLELTNVNANQTIIVYNDEGRPSVKPFASIGDSTSSLAPTFRSTSAIKYVHKENDYIDFKREPLIPYKCSRKGPYYALGDVNGDRIDDIFIGGSSGNEAFLFFGDAMGNFKKVTTSAFAADKAFEDNGSVFFDADSDGDKDLYVVSGGAQFDAGSPQYQDRLYMNDGKGNFKKNFAALPKETSNGSHVIAFDYDGDGDQDLFVGGGVMPGKFPLHDKNILLQNNKGKFTDVTTTIGAEFHNTGIVNYASWSDIDNDGKNELLLAGEWMSPSIYKFDNSKFNVVNATVKFADNTFSLSQLTGWWNVIKTSDVDGDGDQDILLGNRGLNSRITATIDEPTTVYAKDFDNNGSYDAVLGFYIWGKLYPMYHRDQLVDQMPFMRKRFLRYRHYAGTTLDDVFTPAQKKDMDVFKAGVFESGVLINEGDGNFRFVPFHERAQLSNINDLVVDDFNKDGKSDILVSGNSTDPDVSTGNYAATPALLLTGDGKGNFTPETWLSGLSFDGEVRRIIQLQNKIIFLLNNKAALSYLK